MAGGTLFAARKPLPSPGELGLACPHQLGEKGSDQRWWFVPCRETGVGRRQGWVPSLAFSGREA